MKKLKKHILLCSVLTFLLALTGCGEEEVLNFEVNRDSMTQLTQNLIDEFKETNEVEQDYYLSDGTDFQKTAVAGFLAAETTDHAGKFVEFAAGDDAVEITNGANGKVMCKQICKYENRDVMVSISYSQNKAYELDKQKLYEQLQMTAFQNGMELTDYIVQAFSGYEELDVSGSVSAFLDSYLAAAGNEYAFTAEECEVSAIYSKKELLANGGKNTAIGMGVVFVVLIFISFIISLLKYLPLLFDADIRKARAEEKAAAAAAKKKTEEMIIGTSETKEAPAAAPAAPVAAPAPAGENLMDDAELVAVITAAVYAASSGVRGPAYTASNDKLVVRSIRRAKR